MINAYMIIALQDKEYCVVDIVRKKTEADALANRVEGFVEPLEDFDWTTLKRKE